MAFGSLTLMIMGVSFFVSSPRAAVGDLQKAVAESDMQAIDRKVDFNAIQEDIPFLAEQLAAREASMRKGPVLHQMTVDVAKEELERYTTPRGLEKALSGEDPGLLGTPAPITARPIQVHRTSLTSFTARIPDSLGLEYELRGLSWTITGIEMPERRTRTLL